MPPGIIYFKFIVNKVWKCSTGYEIISDIKGNQNNFFLIKGPPVTVPPPHQEPEHVVVSNYTQHADMQSFEKHIDEIPTQFSKIRRNQYSKELSLPLCGM